MTDYTELRRLATEATQFPEAVSVSQYPTAHYKKIVAEQAFYAAASPDVVLALIKTVEEQALEIQRLTGVMNGNTSN